ncbi:MAG: DEAD/DEAH box helicase [Candidatus Nitrosocaldaceae archaeon]|nr:MAG: DEAD/DEAH box helicase [Candidatus Nitrosocaldaceae archaeon]
MEVEIELRKWQEELKDEVIEALKNNNLVVLQAPTGSGKTLFALITALALNKRVLIVTRTINEYDPIVRELNRLGIYDYTLLVGKEKGCLILGEELLRKIEEKSKRKTLDGILGIEDKDNEKTTKNPICNKCYYYQALGEVPKDLTILNKLGYYYAKKREEIAKQRVKAVGEERERLEKEFNKYSICPYRSLLSSVLASKVIVGTYAYLFKYLEQLKRKEEDLEAWLNNLVVIIDEAHNLENIHSMDDKIIKKENIEKAIEELEKHREDIISSYFEVKSLKELVSDIAKMLRIKEYNEEEIDYEGKEWLEDYECLEEYDNEAVIVDAIIDKAIEILKDLYAKIPDNDYTKLYKLDKTQYKLKYIELEALGEAINYLITEKRAYSNYTMYIAEALAMIHSNNTRVYSNGKDIEVKVINPSYLLDILNKNIPILAMSGTMPSKDYMVNVYNINEDIIIEFDISKRRDVKPLIFTRFHVDLTTEYKKRDNDMYKKYADRIVEISKNAEKSVLVMFSSYDMLNKIANYLPKELKILKEYRKTSIKKFQEILVNLAESNNKAVILVVARGKLTEGIEFVHNGRSLISDIIIIGVPYKPYDDYIKDSIGFINNKLGKEAYKVILEEIYIAVKQCIGRAVRSNSDSAKVWLLDKRFKNRYWKYKL